MKRITVLLALMLSLTFCSRNGSSNKIEEKVYRDTTFIQEYHNGYPVGLSAENNDIRSIAIDSLQNVWIATRGGVFVKWNKLDSWESIQNKKNSGPSFSVTVDSDNNVWFSTWNGLYKYANGKAKKIETVTPPISKVVATKNGVFTFGYHGSWQIIGNEIKKLDINISKGVRDAISDGNNGLWIASDVGLYHYVEDDLKLYQSEDELISCYLRGVSYSDNNELWLGGLGGVTIRNEKIKLKTLLADDGIPNGEVLCVEKSPDGVMWVGTELGIVRYSKDGSHSLRFSKRWLLDDKVRDITFDKSGNAWIATANGVSTIKKRELTLAKKAKIFHEKLLKKHIRDPWIVHRVTLDIEGDTASWRPWDDDNDGEYTGVYMSMESLKYAATRDEEARENVKKAFHTLKFLQEVTETDGFFARTVVPVGWGNVNDRNRKYTDREAIDELVKNPRFKRVEERWRKSKDGKWLWKGDTSSDEMVGHFMAYYYYYEFAADEDEKNIIRTHVRKIMDYLISNNYNFIDVDGTHTLWAVWSPEKLNRDPDWAPERYLNSFELLSFLKFTYHITNDEKYETEYLRLINKEGYLENASKLNNKNPAWEIYFDIPMAGYLFPILVKCEDDPELKKHYENLMDEWFENQISGKNPLNNFIYCYARDVKTEVKNSIAFLIDTPLDLVDWKFDHTKREDVNIVRYPILEETQIDILPPASERAAVRWDKNPWSAVRGNGRMEREPVFWLFPYWMGRYLEIIQN
ncbi:MAG: regulator [Ignavibacteriae bacterium]|nr:regulator [Ignavibacteriota bacterium]